MNKFLNSVLINRPENDYCEYEVTEDAMKSYIEHYSIYKNWKVVVEKKSRILMKDGNSMSADILTSIKSPANTIIKIITGKKQSYYGKNKYGCEIVQDILNDKIECLNESENGKMVLPYLKLFASVYYTIGNMMPIPKKSNPGLGGEDNAIYKIKILRKMFDNKNTGIADWERIKEIYNNVFIKDILKTEKNVNNLLHRKCPGYKILWSKWVAEYNNNWENFVKDNYLQDFIRVFEEPNCNDYKISNISNGENAINWLKKNSELIIRRNLRLISNDNEESISKYKNDIMKLYENFNLVWTDEQFLKRVKEDNQ